MAGMKERIIGNKFTTILGSAIGAGVAGAVAHWQSTGGTDLNWQNYAIAAGAGAVPVIVGGLMKDPRRLKP